MWMSWTDQKEISFSTEGRGFTDKKSVSGFLAYMVSNLSLVNFDHVH